MRACRLARINRRAMALLAVLALFVIPACALFANSQGRANRPAEAAAHEIRLAGPAARNRAEFSGMAWYGETLILLPQYPERMARGGGALFALTKAEILAYLAGETTKPLRPREIAFDAGRLRREIRGYEGYEAIAFSGDTAFLTIEASPGSKMKSYLVRGQLAPDLSLLRLDTETLVEAPLDAQIPNFSHEALLVDGERVIVFYEANGAVAVESPRAFVYDFDLNLTGALALPGLEYRLTDATAATPDGRFWVINFFFPLDVRIFTRADDLSAGYGRGSSHAASFTIERLVEMRLPGTGETAITYASSPPLQLRLAGQIPRNWEGLVRLDERGFLLITDKFPRTMLAFVGLK